MSPNEIRNYLERSKDVAFTYHYSQPKEYHFCLDSVIFSQFISEQISATDTSKFRALDLFAGCGIVGIELCYYHRWIEHFDFLELQKIYSDHFYENLLRSQNNNRKFEWLESDFKILIKDEYREKYDLIVANPPYFRTSEGIPSVNSIRKKARFLEDSSFGEMLRIVEGALKPLGRAYLLMRSGLMHGRSDEDEISQALSKNSTWAIAARIRGTHVLEIIKNR